MIVRRMQRKRLQVEMMNFEPIEDRFAYREYISLNVDRGAITCYVRVAVVRHVHGCVAILPLRKNDEKADSQSVPKGTENSWRPY